MPKKYKNSQRYLISPNCYELYVSVMKMVVLIVVVVCACTGTFLAVFSFGPATAAIATIVGIVFNGALQAAFWVTAGFAIFDRYGWKLAHWAPSSLPHLPRQTGVRISRPSAVVGIALSVFFPVFFIMMILRSEWFLMWLHTSEALSPFSRAALDRSIPFIILLGVIALAINGLKLFWAIWDLRLCIANAIQNIAWLGIVVYILHWPDLLSDDFAIFANNVSKGVRFFTIVFGAVAATDIGLSVWNTRKGILGQQGQGPEQGQEPSQVLT